MSAASDRELTSDEWDRVFEARLSVVDSYGFDPFRMAEVLERVRAAVDRAYDGGSINQGLHEQLIGLLTPDPKPGA